MKIKAPRTLRLPLFTEGEKGRLLSELLRSRGLSYSDSKQWSQAWDERLGLDAREVEGFLKRWERLSGFPYGREKPEGRQEFWIGLGSEEMQTPYSELLEIVDAVLLRKPAAAGETWMDLGAGYGRLGVALALLLPDSCYRGLEYVSERVRAGSAVLRRFGYPPEALQRQDLADPGFSPPAASVYFIFDYGSAEARAKTLADLQAVARLQSILVVARGRGIRNQIDRGAPWLSQVERPDHYSAFSVYRSGGSP